jgi:PIN domain nuclease of toxin-antitoxin system
MVGFLLDTHVVLWMRGRSRHLPEAVRQILSDPFKPKYYSVITPWELSIKCARGKIILEERFFTSLSQLGMDCLSVTERHTDALRQLPHVHYDPFDRMLAAQAIVEGLTVITTDKHLAQYPIKTLWIEPD